MVTKFSTDWDVDYYKTDYESDEHWELRRSFMLKHQDKFPEDEIVCLAQVFTNVEFLGCKYPDDTMRKVGLLSAEVAEEFRKSRQNKIKRTFVGASDAAGAKVKGRGSPSSSSSSATSKLIKTKNIYTTPLKFVGATITQSTEILPKPSLLPQTKTASKPQNITDRKIVSKKRKHESNKIDNDSFKNPTKQLEPNIYQNLVLYEHDGDPHSIINTSVSKQFGKTSVCTVSYERQDNEHKAIIHVNGVLAGEAVGDDKNQARIAALAIALENLRNVCYTIKPKTDFTKIQVDSNAGRDVERSDLTKQHKNKLESNKLNETNKGFKMMKMLGWTGGALGVGGIEEPISVEIRVDRQGLGLESNSAINKKYFYDYLTKYRSETNNIHELVFSSEYTKDERAQLHIIARKLGLKSKSNNLPNGERYLVISKKLPIYTLAEDVLNNGIYSAKFDLILPRQQQKQK